MIALIAICSVLLYAVGIGVTWQLHPEHSASDNSNAMFAAGFWPIALPAMAGAAIVRKVQARRAPLLLPKATARLKP